MELNTSRLRLEKMTGEDDEFLFGLMTSPSYLTFVGERGIKKVDDARAFIREKVIQSYLDFGFGYLKIVLKSTDKPIGICGLLERDYLPNVDIGYALLPEYERQGFAIEAARAMLGFAFQELGRAEVWAMTTENNVRSQKLLRKLDFNFVEKKKIEQDPEELMFFVCRPGK